MLQDRLRPNYEILLLKTSVPSSGARTGTPPRLDSA
jgi:hypothetical protein